MATSLCWCTSRFHFGTLFPLIYVNDLSNDISSTSKLFVNDSFIFSLVDDVNVSVVKLNNLFKISKWEYQWKISFNPDVPKTSLRGCALSQKPQTCSLPQAIPLFFAILLQLKDVPFRNVYVFI